VKAAAGEIAAGLLPVVDYFRLQDTFERIGHIGIAVRGRARSVLLFSRKPIRQLDDAAIAVTGESSTTACLLRLLLQARYHVTPSAYLAAPHPEADALLLIGDEALRFQRTNTQYPFEIDVAFEWWMWQHLPFVFAVWAVRKDANQEIKKSVELGLVRSLARNLGHFEEIAAEYSPVLAIPAADLQTYLSSFIYRLGRFEEEGIARFKELVDEHHLL